MADFIRLKSSHTLKDLLGFLGKSPEKIIYLDIPSGSPLWQERSLMFIRRAGREADKKVVLVTNSRVAKIRAEKIGLPTLTEAQLFRGRPKPSYADQAVAANFRSTSPAKWVAEKAGRFEPPKIRMSRQMRRVTFAASVLLALLAGFVISNLTLQRAVITVYARTSNLNGNIDVVVSQTRDQESVAAIAGIPVNQTLAATAEFAATGSQNRGSAAVGVVELRSSHSVTLRLGVGTTYLFVEPGGQRFRFAEDVTGLQPNVPKPVAVAAEEPGTESNLPAGTRLEVRNAVLGHQPNILYAEVSPPGLTGGSNEVVKVASEADLIRAREELQNQAITQVQASLKQANPDFELLSALVKLESVAEDFSAQAGQEASKFNGSLTATITGLAVNKSDLSTLVEQEVKNQLVSPQTFIGLADNFNYLVRSQDLNQGLAVVNVRYAAKVATQLDEENIRVLLAGKTSAEIKDILLKKPEIASVKVDLSPFWRKSTPSDTRRLIIRLDIEP